LIASIQPLKNFSETALIRASFCFASLLFESRLACQLHISSQRIESAGFSINQSLTI